MPLVQRVIKKKKMVRVENIKEGFKENQVMARPWHMYVCGTGRLPIYAG